MTTETKKTSGLANKLAAAMGEIGRVQKRGHNQAQGYKYARADDVAEEARSVLSKHGIAVFASVKDHGVREVEGKNGKIRISMATVEWTFKDGESGEERTVTIPGEGQDSGDKGIYKAMTGSLKYALMLGFLIPTGDGDPEKDDEEDEAPKRNGTNGKTPEQRTAEVDRFRQQLRDPKARKAAVLKWFAREYGEVGMRSKVEGILGRSLPKDQEEITLNNEAELEKLEQHRHTAEALAPANAN